MEDEQTTLTDRGKKDVTNWPTLIANKNKLIGTPSEFH
jgi:hypothetical protein